MSIKSLEERVTELEAQVAELRDLAGFNSVGYLADAAYRNAGRDFERAILLVKDSKPVVKELRRRQSDWMNGR